MSFPAESFPKALPAPDIDPRSGVLRMDSAMIEQAIAMSRESPRKRIILPVHRSAAESPHRMFNALQPGTYIRPHRHCDPPKYESVVVLRGEIGYVTFAPDGTVTSHFRLSPEGGDFGVDIGPETFHTFVALAPDTVIFEVKTGPYSEATDKDMAAWAPAEGNAQCVPYLAALTKLFSDFLPQMDADERR